MVLDRPLRVLRFAEGVPEIPRTDELPANELSRLRDEGHPLVLLAHPAGEKSDRSKFVRFARSAALQAQWRREGRLVVAENEDPAVVAIPADRLEVPPAETPSALEERKRMWEATQTLYELPVAVGTVEKARIVRGALDVLAIVETARRSPSVPVVLLDREPSVFPSGPMIAREDQG